MRLRLTPDGKETAAAAVTVSGASALTSTVIGKQGNNMRDTIELLEAIGRDAALRDASAEELAELLAKAGATEALVKAAALGDSSHLDGEFGRITMHTTQISQTPCHEDDDDGDDDGDDDCDDNDDQGDDDCDDEPQAPPAPGHAEP